MSGIIGSADKIRVSFNPSQLAKVVGLTSVSVVSSLAVGVLVGLGALFLLPGAPIAAPVMVVVAIGAIGVGGFLLVTAARFILSVMKKTPPKTPENSQKELEQETLTNEALYNQGEVCLGNGEAEQALSFYQRAAKQGDVQSLRKLAFLHCSQEGKDAGILQDTTLALSYMKDYQASLTSGGIPLSGQEVFHLGKLVEEKEPNHAWILFLQAADLNSTEACSHIIKILSESQLKTSLDEENINRYKSKILEISHINNSQINEVDLNIFYT